MSYPVLLLNDLHHWFPELLYNSQRFQTVQDVLGYIIQVANENTYQANRQRYHSYYHPQVPLAQHAMHAQHAQPSATSSSSYSATPHRTGGILDILFANHPAEEEVHVSSVSVQPTSHILSSLLGHVFHGRRDTSAMENFLNQTVIVRPSAQQIDAHTTATVASEEQEDNCAICQDSMEEGQEIRSINHCRHTFHMHCIDTWFETNVRCPTCRHDIRGGHPRSAGPPP
jgi:hypothetical protein